MRRWIALFILFAVLLALPACKTETGGESSSIPEEVGFTFVDDLNRTVTVDNPQRVAVLLGSFAEVWLLSGGQLVAATDDAWTERELDLSEDVRSLGSIQSPSLEWLLASKPDLVILSSNTAAQVNMMESLENAKLTLAYFSVNSFPEYLHMLDICTQITGRRDLYDANGLAVQRQIDAVMDRIPQLEQPPRVLLLRAASTNVKAKNSESTVTGIMLKELGCVNIAEDESSLLENLSLESILYQDPDYIFVVVQGTDGQAAMEQMETLLTSNKAWSGLTAVKEGRYYILDKQLFHFKPNHRWGESYEILADILYGTQE